jgi:hypothetical protein
MASTSASSRPSDPKWKKILKQPELERAIKDCDFSYLSDLECESEIKSDTSESFEYCDDSGWQKDGVRDVGPKRHDFTATSTGKKIHLTAENTPKDYFKLFLKENLVQAFVDEINTYANNFIVNKQLSPRSIWSTWKDVTVTEFWCFLATVIINMVITGLPNMKDYWSQEWSYHVKFFNYIFSRDRFMQIFWMLQLFSTPPTTGPVTRAKTMLYRLKAIDANKKPTTNLQFRRKLVEELSADRIAVQGSKKQGCPFSNDGAERLGGKQHFRYANEPAIPKTVSVF